MRNDLAQSWRVPLKAVVLLFCCMVIFLQEPGAATVAEALEAAVEETSSRVCPAVVHISGEPRQEKESTLLLERLFAQWWPSLAEEGLLGSGFLADREGHVVTTSHVVAGVDRVQLATHDGRTFSGKVVGRDPAADIAVIKTGGMSDVEPLTLGDSSELRQGQWVLAVGSPMGLQGTVSLGIVSAVRREGLGLTDLDTYIQTDAMLGPGSSGGPLVNLRGEVVGVCTGLGCTGSHSNVGPGFAIPSDALKDILPRLKQEGAVRRGWLGVSVKEASDSGAEVTRVLTPARKELSVGDLIVGIGGQPVRGPGELKRLVLSREPGDALTMDLVRGEKRVSVELALLPLPGGGATLSELSDYAVLMGATLVPSRPSQDVLVDRVSDGSPAWRAGIRRGDRILEINGALVSRIEEIDGLLKECEGSVLSVLLDREGATRYVELER